jgi:hypothetical protein
MIWNKQQHDFGKVKVGEKLETTFQYFGEEALVASDFHKMCTCTGFTWDRARGILTVGLKNDTTGYKSSFIKVKGVELSFKAIAE